jgi:DNA repair protein RecO (recombination protein O)
MGRNSITEAVILRSQRFAEYHKRVTLLTDSSGIVDAIAYGAFKSKSKLAGITESFTRLRAYLYVDPVKKQHKLSDGELVASNDGIRADLKRFYIASIISELVQITYAGGDEYVSLFPLIDTGFRVLSSASDRVSDLLLVQVLIRFFTCIGYPPPWAECERCGSAIAGSSARSVSPGGLVYCSRCGGDAVSLPPGSFAYLEHTEQLTFREALRVDVGNSALDGLKRALLSIAQKVAESPLRSLRGAEPILF